MANWILVFFLCRLILWPVHGWMSLPEIWWFADSSHCWGVICVTREGAVVEKIKCSHFITRHLVCNAQSESVKWVSGREVCDILLQVTRSARDKTIKNSSFQNFTKSLSFFAKVFLVPDSSFALLSRSKVTTATWTGTRESPSTNICS